MWGSVLDDMKGYRSRNSTAPPTPEEIPRPPTLRASLSRRFSFVRRNSQKFTATPSVIYTPPPQIQEHHEDPLAAAGAVLPSPPMSPSALNQEEGAIQAAGMSHLHPESAMHPSSTTPRTRPISFAPDILSAASSSGAHNPTTPGSERPALERRRSRRERLVAGLNRSLSWRSSSYDAYNETSTAGGTIDGRLSRGVGSIRRTLSRSYSSQAVRMPTEAEIVALEGQRERDRYPYDTEYDYMGSMAYCDGMWFNEDLEDE